MYYFYRKSNRGHGICPLYRGCPPFGESVIRGFTVHQITEFTSLSSLSSFSTPAANVISNSLISFTACVNAQQSQNSINITHGVHYLPVRLGLITLQIDNIHNSDNKILYSQKFSPGESFRQFCHLLSLVKILSANFCPT